MHMLPHVCFKRTHIIDIHDNSDQLHFTPKIFPRKTSLCHSPRHTCLCHTPCSTSQWRHVAKMTGKPTVSCTIAQPGKPTRQKDKLWVCDAVRCLVPFKHSEIMTMMVLKQYNLWFLSWFVTEELSSHILSLLASANRGSNNKSMMMFHTFNTFSAKNNVFPMCNHITPPVSGT